MRQAIIQRFFLNSKYYKNLRKGIPKDSSMLDYKSKVKIV